MNKNILEIVLHIIANSNGNLKDIPKVDAYFKLGSKLVLQLLNVHNNG